MSSLSATMSCNDASGKTVKSRLGPEDKIMASLTTGTNCLVTNLSLEMALVYCKALTRATNSQLDNLEKAWRMPPNTFNFNSKYNIFKLDMRLSSNFQFGNWILLPEPDVLDILSSSTDVYGYVRANKTWVYRYVTPPCGPPLFYHHHPISPDDETGPTEENYDVYPYPYDNFPTIKSHIWPNLVVCSIGEKLQRKFFRRLYLGRDSQFPHSDKILVEQALSIYESWIGKDSLSNQRLPS